MTLTWNQNKNSFARKLYGGLALIALPFVFSCHSATVDQEKDHRETGETHPEKTEVTITQKQFDAIKIELGTIEQKNLTDVLKVTGFLKVPPQNKAYASLMTGGTVQSILVQEGDYVLKGQVLATLASSDFIRMQQEFLTIQSQLKFAEVEYARQKELAGKNIAAQKTFQESESNYHSLVSRQNALAQLLGLLGVNSAILSSENISPAISVRSPIKGNISHIDINIGSAVEAAQELMAVVDNSQLHLDLFVYEQDLSKVKVDQPVEVTLTNLPGKQYRAIIFAIGSAFEEESKSIPVHAAIIGDKTGLIEGMNVTANISLKSDLVSAVAATAIINSGGNDYIFTLVEGSFPVKNGHDGHEDSIPKEEPAGAFRFARVPVSKGVTNDAFTEITPLQDLPENSKVVINGAFYLMSMLTNLDEEEHEH